MSEVYLPQVHLLVPRGLLHHECHHSGEGVPASWMRGQKGCEVLPSPAGTGTDWQLQHPPAVLPPSSNPRGGRQPVNCTTCAEGRACSSSTDHFPVHGTKGRCCYCWNVQQRRKDSPFRCRQCQCCFCLDSRDEGEASCFERWHTGGARSLAFHLPSVCFILLPFLHVLSFYLSCIASHFLHCT